MADNEVKDLVILDTPDENALLTITRGEVDMQVSTAKQYPRSVSRVLAACESLATMNQQIAESCVYAMPRGGKVITGPSVRLAEIMMTAWGNMRVESRITNIGSTMVTAQAQAWDMESNTAVRVETQRRITDRSGKKFADDMIIVTANAAASIALRNAVFRIVPRPLVEQVREKCERVAAGNEKTIGARRAASIEWFKGKGVSEEQVLSRVDAATRDDLDAQKLAMLFGLANAIREGEITVDQAFAEQVAQDDLADLNASLKDAAPATTLPPAAPKPKARASAATKPKAQPAPAQEPEEPDEPTTPEAVVAPEARDVSEIISGARDRARASKVKWDDGTEATLTDSRVTKPVVDDLTARRQLVQHITHAMIEFGSEKMESLIRAANVGSDFKVSPSSSKDDLEKVAAKVDEYRKFMEEQNS